MISAVAEGGKVVAQFQYRLATGMAAASSNATHLVSRASQQSGGGRQHDEQQG